MDEKTKQLIDDLIHNPNKYESLITEYFNTFDIDSLGLTYDNFENDIKILIKFIKQILDSISNSNNTDILYTLEKIEKLFKNIQTFFNSNNYIKFNLSNSEFNTLINSIAQSTNDINTTNFINYLKANMNLYQSYYNYIYIYKFKIILSNISTFINYIFLNICKKYLLNSNQIMYKYQLYRESHKERNDDSKFIVNLLEKYKVSASELYNKIINNPSDFNISIQSKIKIANIDFNNVKKNINLPKFNKKNIKEDMLTKTVGLCNPELYNLLNNSEIDICYANKSFYSLNNDIRINIRNPDTHDIKSLYYKNKDNDTITAILNNIIKIYISKFIKGYILDITDNYKILFYRDAIINVDFTQKEFENLDKLIKECTHRYILIYCTQVSNQTESLFNKAKKLLKGGHKSSLIIDTKKNTLTYFDPFGFDSYKISYIETINIPIINLILCLEFAKNIKSLNNYTFLDANNFNAAIQTKEYKPTLINKEYYYNFKQIFSPEKQKLRDWAGGYCGLWNYLYIFLLVINPHLDLQDIYSFFYKLTNLDYSPMFVKLLIRNFAYYIENALVTPNYVIPLTQLDMKQFDNIAINEVKFDANNEAVKLRSMHSSDYYQKEANLQNNEQEKVDNFEFDEFIANLTTVTWSLKEDLPKVKKLYAIAKDFSKYLFAKGGLALYTPDKVNFLKI